MNNNEKVKRNKNLNNLFVFGLHQTFRNVHNQLKGKRFVDEWYTGEGNDRWPFNSIDYENISEREFIFDNVIYTLSDDGKLITIQLKDDMTDE